MKRILSIVSCLCLPFMLMAQTDEKYLEGAVPMKDGKVTFSVEMDVPAMTQGQIYETILEWASNRFQPDEKFNDRILYQDESQGSMAIGGEEYLVFSSTALALDRTRIYYQLRVDCTPGKCGIDMTRIRYWYDEARNGGEKYNAEEWITDDMALNKSKTKLAPICGKFRRETIDLKDELFSEVRSCLGNKMIALGLQAAPVTPAQQVVVNTPQPAPAAAPVVAVTPAAPAVAATPVATTPVQPQAPAQATADSAEALIAQAVRMTITAGNDEQFEISKECWGGFGELFGKKVAFCLIDTQKTMGNLLLSQNENYTLSFYTANSNEPCITVRCKKLMQQNVSGAEAKKMSPSCADEKSYNMYVGEILK